MFTSSTFVSALALVAVSTAMPTRRQAGAVITSCSVPGTAALTFDDGPAQWTIEMVDMLDSKGAKGTFFVNGNNYGCIYDEMHSSHVKYAYEKGHQLASHTWAHANLATLSYEEVDDEFSKVDLALERIIGVKVAMMRPPFGSFNDIVRSVAEAHGELVVNWDFDSADSAGAPVSQSNAMYDGLAQEKPATILALNHETYEGTARGILPHAIDTLQAAGYRLVTVAECLNVPAYSRVGPAGTPDASWTC